MTEIRHKVSFAISKKYIFYKKKLYARSKHSTGENNYDSHSGIPRLGYDCVKLKAMFVQSMIIYHSVQLYDLVSG